MRLRPLPGDGQTLVAGATAAAAAVLAFTNGQLGDYRPGGAPVAGNAAPAIDALLDGDPARAASVQPLLGPVSVLLRVPAAGIADLFGGDATAGYQAGALACLLGPVVLAVVLSAAMRERGAGMVSRLVLALLCVVNPMTVEAVRVGHPEEPLAAALAVGAVLAAARRPAGAGALLGLAVATKQWAVVVAPVALLAARRPRPCLALGVVAVAAAAVVLVPATLADPEAAARVRDSVLDLRTANVIGVWWAYSPGGVVPFGITRTIVAPALLAMSVAVSLVAWRVSNGRPELTRVLAVLALVSMLRCAFDPQVLEYYFVAPMLALCAWEAHGTRRLPWVSLAYAAAVALAYGPLLDAPSDTTIGTVSLTGTAVFALVAGAGAFRPPRPASSSS